MQLLLVGLELGDVYQGDQVAGAVRQLEGDGRDEGPALRAVPEGEQALPVILALRGQAGVDQGPPGGAYYPGNNVANSRLKWGLRIARSCMTAGGAGRAQASIGLVVDVALGGDGESRR